MTHSTEKQDKYTLVTLHEEKLNSLVSPDLKAAFVMASGEGTKNIIFDISTARYADSSGLSAILVANRLCKNNSGTFVLTGVQDNVKKLITISQLDSVLNVIPTVNEAVDFLFMEEMEREIKNN
jgi:anti-anti-sigma factor